MKFPLAAERCSLVRMTIMPVQLLSAASELLSRHGALVFLSADGATSTNESYAVFCEAVAELEKTSSITACTVPESAVFLAPLLGEAGLTCPIGTGSPCRASRVRAAVVDHLTSSAACRRSSSTASLGCEPGLFGIWA
jgi:hypothetical protein